MQRHLLDPVGSSSVPRVVVVSAVSRRKARRLPSSRSAFGARSRGAARSAAPCPRDAWSRPGPCGARSTCSHPRRPELPFADGLRTVVGEAELAAVLRRDYETGGRASPRRPRGARRDGPHPGGTGGGGRRKARAWACRPSAPLRLGWRSPPACSSRARTSGRPCSPISGSPASSWRDASAKSSRSPPTAPRTPRSPSGSSSRAYRRVPPLSRDAQARRDHPSGAFGRVIFGRAAGSIASAAAIIASSAPASCIRSATAWARGRCRSCSARSICASIREPHAAVVSSALLDRAAATTSPFDAAAGQP
jgi:hypothetical protein